MAISPIFNPKANNFVNIAELRGAFLDISAELSRLNRISSGTSNFVFDSGFKISYDPADMASGKWVYITDTANADDMPEIASYSTSNTFAQVALPANNAAVQAGAIACEWEVTVVNFNTATGNIRNPNDGAYASQDGMIVRDDSLGTGVQVDDGHHGWCLTTAGARVVPIDTAIKTRVILANINDTIQFRAGASTLSATQNQVLFRLMSYWV